MMRVLFVLENGSFLWGGGGPIQAAETATALRNRGVTVDFLTPLTSELGYDVAHFFGLNPHFRRIARVLASRGIPYVSTPVYFPKTGFSRIKSRLRERLSGSLWVAPFLDQAAAVLPNTEAESKLLQKDFHVPGEKVHITPNGVNPALAVSDPTIFREKFGLEEDFVLNVARVDGRKNQHRLCQACRKLDYPLVVIGPQEHEGYVQACRRVAGEKFRLIPPLPHEDPVLHSAYAACKVFCLPSFVETPGLSALEAALSCPRIVITRVGGTREYFGEQALYVDPRSLEDLESKLQSAWQEPDNGSKALRAHVLGNFTWQQVAQKTLTVYEKGIRSRL